MNIPTSWSGVDIGSVYWQNLAGSAYALELERIYGVQGSEYVGYQPSKSLLGIL